MTAHRNSLEPRTGSAATKTGALDTWLPRGIGLRRWALVLGAGVTLLGLGLAMLITNLYRQFIMPQSGTTLLYPLTLQFIPHPWREILLALVGVVLIGMGVRGIVRALQTAAQQGRPVSPPAILAPLRAAHLPQGPRVVAIGGGTGMPNLLRGLKHVTDNITAVVTAADDGGSSGRLRREGMLPPGDFRNNVVALSEVEPLLEALFQYRFGPDSKELAGHAFGNLFIAAMVGVTGNFEQAIRESEPGAGRARRCPAVHPGRRDPQRRTGRRQHHRRQVAHPGGQRPGQARLPHPAAPARLPRRHPRHPRSRADHHGAGQPLHQRHPQPAGARHRAGGAIVANAVKVYVCNVATQPGETSDFGVVGPCPGAARQRRAGRVRLCAGQLRPRPRRPHPPGMACQPVRLAAPTPSCPASPLSQAPVVNPENPLRHDPERLAAALIEARITEHYRPRRPTGRRRTPRNGLYQAHG